MKKKEILVVAMLDSIHTARWLSQFKDENINFIIFGSKKHKQIHPQLIQLLNSKGQANFTLAHFKSFLLFAGYLDFFFFIFLPRFFHFDLRLKSLTTILRNREFSYVHALEIQGAGYLADQAIRKSGINVKFILTNWGSDIYFFERYKGHKLAIQSALDIATHYSAECKRDYELARNLGFKGIELPCIPNAGGFELELTEDQSQTSERTKIVAKAYGGDFGRGDLVIEALSHILHKFTGTEAFLYSVTDDLIQAAEHLKSEFPGRVEYSGQRSPLSRHQMSELFLQSRVYVGASRTDGISTSFLEALVSGCYPVQTNTSCAGEWIINGAQAALVGMDVDQISEAIESSLINDSLVDEAQSINRQLAESYLSTGVIRPIALTFYAL